MTIKYIISFFALMISIPITFGCGSKPDAATGDKPKAATNGELPKVDPAPKKEKRGDAELLQGKWEVLSVESEGKVVTENDPFLGAIFTFDGTKIVIDVKGRKEKTESFKLKADEIPKQIDFKRDEFNSTLGIYELNGDTLKICLTDIPDKPRPMKFSTEKEKTYVLSIVLKRVKK